MLLPSVFILTPQKDCHDKLKGCRNKRQTKVCRTLSDTVEHRSAMDRKDPILLENKLRCQLHVATFDVAVGGNPLGGANESAADILCTGSDVKVRMVKRVK